MLPLAIYCFTLQIFVTHFAICGPDKSLPKTSCLDYLKDGIRNNGIYSVAAKNGERFKVFCDFSSEPGLAWTLVMSWSLSNKMLPAFRSEPMTENAPVNENSPNWIAYRLSKQKMAHVKSNSGELLAVSIGSQSTT